MCVAMPALGQSHGPSILFDDMPCQAVKNMPMPKHFKTPAKAPKAVKALKALALLMAVQLICSDAVLPTGKLIVGYQDWSACDRNKTLTAAAAGVNVVIWFAINLVADTQGKPAVEGGPDHSCMAQVAQELDRMGVTTAHLISIGGWDAPHPAAVFSGAELFVAWNAWNAALPRPFDGFDWDLEGNDDPAASSNSLAVNTLHQVIDMSVAAHAAGLVVTLVPAQSYFDESTEEFNLSLLNSYAEWHPEFHYHGRNGYAYVWAAAPPHTFSLVTVQLYESWSRADQALLTAPSASAGAQQYLQQWWTRLTDGSWAVDFGNITDGLRVSGRHIIAIEPSQLVVGLSRGDEAGKSAFIWPEDAAAAWGRTDPHMRPRGFAFWNIAMEGQTANGTENSLAFAPGLNAFLHVR
jgi:hypothetical protein